MSKALVLGVVVLAFSAAGASAQAVYPGNGYAPYASSYAPYGYGYTASAPLYNYTAPPYGYTYDYTPGMWNRGYWIRQEWR